LKKRSDPFTNWGTSKVFYKLLQGVTTPKGIAESLRITSPATIEQLRRLQKVGIVRIGAKAGKFQHYEINWSRFVETLIDRAPKLNAVYSTLSRLPDYPARPSETRWGSILCENKYFQSLVAKCFSYAATTPSEEEPARICDLVEFFEEALMSTIPFLRKKNITDKERDELLSSLEHWNNFVEGYNPHQEVFMKFFKQMKLL